MREPSDRDLVRRARHGDRDAAAALFRRYWRDAWRAAFAVTGRRSLADDVAADGFERAFAALGRFDERRPFGPWLHRIVVNRAIDWTRARKLRAEVELGEYLPAPPEPELNGDALGRIADLTPEHRAVVVLRYVLEYTPGEIAELLDLPRGTVNSRLRRGLDRMKESP